MAKERSSKWQGFFAYGLLVFALMLAMSVPVRGQSGDGALSGTIRDPGGAVVPNAPVVVIETATGTKYQTVTNVDGRFVFPDVRVGTYTVTISAPGFKQEVRSGVTVSISTTTTVDTALQIGQASQSVVVNGDATQLQTESSEIGTTVPTQLVEKLPINFGGIVRSPLQFMMLTPGFSGDPTGNPASQAGFKLNGAATGDADIILDGASIQQASPEVEMNFGISSDAVAEFKVLTSTFPAEYGRAAGGVVNLASKSGTNEIHGGVYDLLKNAALDANTWNNNHLGLTKPFDTQNDFGAFAGGPVKIPWLYDGRNKTFWFFSYEGFRFKSGGESTNSIPTPAMWNGDFSALLNGGQPLNINGITYQPRQLYDYTTCSGVNLGNPCEPFPNNQIPASRLDPMSKAFIPYLPKATVTTQPYQNETNVSLNPTVNDLYSFRIDQNIRSNQKLYGGYFLAKMPILSENLTYGPLYNLDFGGTVSHYYRLGYDWSISPTMLNHLNAGYTRDFRSESSPNTFKSGWAAKLGWHGGLVDNIIPTYGIQYDSHSPPTDYGGGGTIPYPPANGNNFYNGSYDYEEDFSWLRGRHNWKFGAQLRLQELNGINATGDAGGFTYNTVLTSAGTDAMGQPIDPNSGSGAASFFLGAASTVGMGGPLTSEARSRYWGFFVQDDWKASPRLTVNWGFRYEIPEPAFETHERTSQVNPTLPNPEAGNLPGAMEFQGTGPGRDGRRTPISTWWKSFGPRLGGAYQLDPQTVLRAGFGLYYGSLKISNFANHESQGFFAIPYNYPVQQNQQTPAAIPSQITSYPGPIPPDLSPGVANGQSPQFLLSRVGLPPRVINWTVDVQRQIPGQWLLDVGYVGATGNRIQVFLKDPNVPNPSNMSRGACLSVLLVNQATNPACAGQTPVTEPFSGFDNLWHTGATVAQALRPFPQYGAPTLSNMFSANPWGNYTYNGLQVRLTKRYGSGLTVLASYTFSKNLTDADSDLAGQAGWNGGNTGALNPYNPKAEKSVSEFDTPQSVIAAYTYELPFGKGKRYLNHSKALDLVAGGWLIGGVDQYQSGTPLQAVNAGGWTSGIFANTATGGTPRPNVVPGAALNGYHGGGFIFGQSRRLNPAGFTIAPNYTFGNAPRLLGNVRNFAQKTEDIQAGKNIPLWTERVVLTFRFDAFNVFNRHSWGCFDDVVGDPNFGVATCGTGPTSTVNNNIPVAGQSRNLQGNFRITF